MPNLTSELIVKLIDGVSGPARAAGNALRNMGMAAKTAGGGATGVAAMQKRLKEGEGDRRGAMVDAVAQAYILKTALTAPLQAAIDLESSMADIRKVVTFDKPTGLEQMKQDLIALSLQLPMTAGELAKITADAAQGGIANEDLLAFTKMAAKVGVAFDLPAQEVGDDLAKMKTQLGLTIDETRLLADSMNYLSNNQASKAAELVDFTKRVGAFGKGAGFSAAQTVAFGSAMISSGVETEIAATSFRNMALALSKGDLATKKQKDAWNELGMDASKVQKSMQTDAIGTTRAVMQALSMLPKEKQTAISSELFGNEARGLPVLLTNLGLLDDSLKQVADQQNYAGSAEKEFQNRLDTTGNSILMFQHQLEAMSIALGDALIPALKSIMTEITPVISAVKDWIAANPRLASTIVEVTSGLVALKIATAGSAWLFGGIAQSALSATLGLAGMAGSLGRFAMMPIANITAGMATAFETMALRTKLATDAAGVAPGIFARLGDGMLVLGRTLLSSVASFDAVSAALNVLKIAVIGTGIGALLVGIAMAGTWIYNNWSGLGAMFQGFGDGLMKGLGPALPIIQPIVDAVKAIFNAVSGLVGPLDATNKEWAAWGETLGGNVAAAINGIVSAIQSVIGVFSTAIGMAKDLGSAIANIAGSNPNAVRIPGVGKVGIAPQKSGTDIAGPSPRARAVGGRFKAGQRLRVGESGTEEVAFDVGGYVTRNSALSSAGGGMRTGGGGVHFAPTIHLNVQGGDPKPIEASVRKIMADAQREFAAMIGGNFSDEVA